MLSAIISVFTNFIHLVLGINTPQNFPPPLSAEQEREYFLKSEEGDKEARRELILHNLRLVSHIVRKYYASCKNQEDLVSIGTIGLIKAVDTFRVSNGAKFATYAARCIQNEILMHFRSQKKLAAEISLNDTIDVDRDGNPLTYIDVIGCDESLTTDIERKISSARAMRLVETMLTPRERKIIVLRYGLGGKKPLTQREIAEKLNISRSYVSRIEKSALDKLKTELGG
ncbi:MAG: RNA polymerase sporulation sigma factor SigK [Clostridia bacterium]|nr:RNA polymerase sporulation sigma factor SigK [Clostridia bacterium]